MKLGKTRVQRLHRLFFVYSSWNPLKVVGGFFFCESKRKIARNWHHPPAEDDRRRCWRCWRCWRCSGRPLREASEERATRIWPSCSLFFLFVFFLVIFSGVSAFDCFFFFCDGRLGTTSETLAQRCRRRTKSTTASCNAEARSYPLPQRRH